MLALVAVAACLLLSGCTVLKGTISTVKELSDAGFGSPQIDVSGGDLVEVRVRRDGEDLEASAGRAAEIVWRNLPLRIETLTVTCENGFGGEAAFSADRSQLIEQLGPRDAALDRGVQRDDVRTLLIVIALAVVVGLLILTAIVVGIVLVVRRNKLRRV